MPLMVARPYKHPKTGIYWLRRAVPDSLRTVVGKREEKFSLGTRDPEEAKRLHAKAIAEMDARWANLRGGARVLTEREAHELAKPIYRNWLVLHQDDPGNQLSWYPELYDRLDLFANTNSLAGLGEEVDDDESHITDIRLDDLQLSSMRTFAWAQAQYVLEAYGLRVDTYSHLKLVRACAIALQRASVILAHSYETGEPVDIESEQPAASPLPPRAAISSTKPHSRVTAPTVAQPASRALNQPYLASRTSSTHGGQKGKPLAESRALSRATGTQSRP